MEINKKLAKGIIERLESLLGDGEMALVPENFSTNRIVIEDIIFPGVKSLEIDIREIKCDYDIELMQSSGSPISSGRLGYIKDHLQKLLDRLNKAIEG